MSSTLFGKTSEIDYKKINELLVAGVGIRATYQDTPQQSMPKFKALALICGEMINSPAMALYDYGVYSDAVHIDVCYPVTEAVESVETTSRVLDAVEVLSIIHRGPYAEMSETYKKLYGYMREHEIVPTAYRREVYLNYDPEDDAKNVTELQVVLHKWEDRFAKNVERVLGVAARNAVMKNSEELYTLESTGPEKAKWLKAALKTIDGLANEDEKYEILSCCAHEFSNKRITQLRAIYARTGDIDAVLKHMNEDPDWYEKPKRKGNIIYVCKVPYDVKSYESAKTETEKKKSYCHCMLVRKHLDEEISPTFCYCGTGWYRQYWEGILGKPVKIEVLRSLLKGDEKCEVAIHFKI